MGPIGLEQLELFDLELGKLATFDFCLLSSIYKYKPISTKLVHTVYEHKISDEFDYGSSHTSSVSVICPGIQKLNFSSIFGIYPHC